MTDDASAGPSTEGSADSSPALAVDPLHADAVTTLSSWRPADDELEALRERYLRFLAEHPDGTRRSCVPDHLTASALVLDASGTQMLLTHHAKGGFWAQMGGHCEPTDTTLASAALREATEESGIPGLVLLPGPVDLDHHELSGAFGTCRSHLDVRYVAVAPPGARPVRSDESRALRWFPLEGWEAAVPEGAVVDLGRLVGAARAAVGG